VDAPARTRSADAPSPTRAGTGAQEHATAYRPEVDGLRALAVVPVILFHARFKAFSGGFVGVDVFFVISGYLISTILLKELERGQFSIARFYERRARRIVPALTVVTLSCVPFAWMWMLPDEFHRFGQSMIAVGAFVSNIFFWKTTDYFSPNAEQQPLLHTWSLAVEEQYYILFPLFLALCWRLGKRRLIVLVGGIALVSLAFSEWGWRHRALMNFYLLPPRAWELLAGVMVAFYRMSARGKAIAEQRPRWAAAASWAGAALILLAVFTFKLGTPCPSVYTFDS
jgi:peptidoglycan/LPS O-acetylase OafA/YrhL